jgi:hypothetical protein
MRLKIAFCLVVAGWALIAPARAAQDWRHRIEAEEFQKTAEGEWTSPIVKPNFPFNELIYSWHLHKPGDAFRIYLKAIFAPGDETDWLNAGYWGNVKDLATNRTRPTFDRGMLDIDFLKLKANAIGFQFKVVSDGPEPLVAPPALTVVASFNDATTNAVADAHASESPVLDVPLRRQVDSHGQRIPDRCQSAALASAMEYFGKSVVLDDIVKYTFDAEYGYPGDWPRVLAAAQEFGYDGYIDRFRDWDAARKTLAENKIILCSIRLKEGECKAPPYRSMGNHIVVLCGVTGDGRVVVTDSALGKDGSGHLCQWLQSDFEKVWMQRKGGVAMVICPPPAATVQKVAQLPPFPANRAFPAGDDH